MDIEIKNEDIITQKKSDVIKTGLEKACTECGGECLYKKKRKLNDFKMEYCEEHTIVLAYKKIK